MFKEVKPPLSALGVIEGAAIRHTVCMLTVLALLTCIGAGTIGGVFFAFSAFVMKALAQLPASQGVSAMQRINVVVLNPVFLSVFVGSALLAGGCAVVPFFPWSTPRSPLLLAAGLLYLLGTFFATMAFNVPRNERLARLDAESSEAASYWPVYVREWSKWNHVRTAASVASAACSAASLSF
jgi:uncharacterized membrane protein